MKGDVINGFANCYGNCLKVVRFDHRAYFKRRRVAQLKYRFPSAAIAKRSHKSWNICEWLDDGSFRRTISCSQLSRDKKDFLKETHKKLQHQFSINISFVWMILQFCMSKPEIVLFSACADTKTFNGIECAGQLPRLDDNSLAVSLRMHRQSSHEGATKGEREIVSFRCLLN